MTLSYSSILGRKASWRAQTLLCPGLPWNQERYGNLLLSYLDAAPKCRWLEAGCGRRILPYELLALERSAIEKASLVVGADMDERSLAGNRSLDRRACASLAQLPFADESFDVVGCNMVTEHLSDPSRCLSELTRVLTRDGVVLIHTPNLHNYMVFLNHLFGKILPRSWILKLIRYSEDRTEDDVFPTFYRMNSAPELRRLARNLGLRIELEEFLPSPQPFFNFFLPLAVIQLLLIRVMTLKPFQGFQSTILVVLRKPGVNPAKESEPMEAASYGVP
jgi:SAM-dependent methyltransferase